MSIRRKLILSNIIIIVFPVIIAIITLSIFIIGPGAQSWETMENLFRDDSGAYTAQSLMQTLEWEGDINVTEREMTSAGYHFSIYVNGTAEYSDLSESDIAAAKNAVGDMYGEDCNFAITKDNVTVVKYINSEDGYTAIAVNTEKIPHHGGEASYMERYIALYVGFLVLIIVASVVVINIIMSFWIAKNILRPLKQLSNGSELIREGHLDFELTSSRRDEMGEVIRDFDEMRRHLKTSVEERMEYEQYRKELINGISHDLRTPLTSIKGYLEGLRDGIADTAEKKIQYYEAIETSVKGLENLIDDLTNFSRVEMGQSHLEMEPVDIAGYLDENLDTLREEYIKDNVTISADIDDEPAVVMMDRREMGRVIRNIVDNTVKYRKTDSSAVWISVHTEGNSVVIRIGDDGPGVAAEDLEKIFTCFYRGDAARTFPSGGSGIGLAVVRQLIGQQGGRVSAENDGGLVIVISMPVYRGEKDE